MEQVLNSRQRNEAFLKFTVFFVFTIAVIIAAVYFNFRIPAEENIQIRKKLSNLENQLYQQEQFLTAMETSKKLIDSMGKSEQFNPLLDREIEDQLNAIEKLAKKSNGIFGTMNREAFGLSYDYSELSKELLQSKDAMQQIEKLKGELNQSETRRMEAERSLDFLRKSNNLGL